MKITIEPEVALTMINTKEWEADEMDELQMLMFAVEHGNPIEVEVEE